MMTAKDIRSYGPVSISLWKYNNSNFSTPVHAKHTRYFEVWDEGGDDSKVQFESFCSYKQAKKFCQRKIYRQYVLQKALAAAAILSKYDLVRVIFTNCNSDMARDRMESMQNATCCHIPSYNALTWLDWPVDVVQDVPIEYDDITGAELEAPDSVPFDLRLSVEDKICTKDIAVIPSDPCGDFIITDITDIWSPQPDAFVFETKSGHDYIITGADDESMAQAIINHILT